MDPDFIQNYKEALEEIKKLDAERTNSEKEKKAEQYLRPLYEEVLKKKNPDNIVYSLDSIQEWIRYFYIADKDANGYVSGQELVDASGEKKEDIADFFKFSDKNSDARISFSEWVIMGFICAEQETEYGRAKKN
ncbi:hypothetical protein BO86DRAFT_397106 [Aspergillus japonicus CBS 114.51]|uniref:EF-hand domain-containing protein n=1 Tax=Aspergillus japonicus CBS 114.51 TaxID=1448312 RepID=A0A8T8X8B5_ASPJA|nr:hypothetical protein BO86DRAFT_397106 [Aspergillus japonicus CBS 114.51]RAH84240.1 hypothetical protein BO86DRAFT_397106 [Aspergillus japonicus CBS 114.51]